MGARDLLKDLARAGLTLSSDGASLVVRPASLLTDDIRVRVRDAKPELLVLLSEDSLTTARRERLLRWGWPVPDAEALAQRLARRDREPEFRVSCIECRHYRPGRCSDHRRAALQSPDVGRDLAGTLQRCPAFVSACKDVSQAASAATERTVRSFD